MVEGPFDNSGSICNTSPLFYDLIAVVRMLVRRLCESLVPHHSCLHSLIPSPYFIVTTTSPNPNQTKPAAKVFVHPTPMDSYTSHRVGVRQDLGVKRAQGTYDHGEDESGSSGCHDVPHAVVYGDNFGGAVLHHLAKSTKCPNEVVRKTLGKKR